jgi:hypothetical protein
VRSWAASSAPPMVSQRRRRTCHLDMASCSEVSGMLNPPPTGGLGRQSPSRAVDPLAGRPEPLRPGPAASGRGGPGPRPGGRSSS